MSQSQNAFLIKQTLTAVFLNGVFSAIAMFLVFRHTEMVPLSGSPSVISDSILQTFIATLMSILPPSIMTAKWMLTRPDLTTARIPTAQILIRALFAALAVCLASSIVLPFALPRLLAASLPFRSMLLLKCVYGMAIGLAVTPSAVAVVLRGPRRGKGTE
jgi:magnesium-transporting ATPase (P-type)